MPKGIMENAIVRVPCRITVEEGNGLVRGYCDLWRNVFCGLANKANEGGDVSLSEIKKLILLSSQIIALTDLKRIKEQFSNYKDMMSGILARKGQIPKEDILAAINEVKARE